MKTLPSCALRIPFTRFVTLCLLISLISPGLAPSHPEEEEMRVMVIGIDSAEPSLVFGEWADELPTISQLARDGLWGYVRTTVPPITCPAWPASLTGLNPGHFGLYDLKYRVPGTYTKFRIVNSTVIKKPRLWDYLTRAGKRSIWLFVPVTYPPSPVNGIMVSGFLTPSVKSAFTHPPEVKEEVLGLVGGPEKYIIDVYDYRRIPPRKLYAMLKAKTEHDFKIIRHMVSVSYTHLTLPTTERV